MEKETNQSPNQAKLENAKAQMRKGLLELCILSIMEEGELYPSDIIEKLREAQLIVVEGTLYPLLTRLKNAGLLNYTWRESQSGPPRKYYTTTTEGKIFSKELKKSWQDLVQKINSITDLNTTQP
jgi:PadR family transcriptional regulator, regulatory protein PadR